MIFVEPNPPPAVHIATGAIMNEIPREQRGSNSRHLRDN
jgi:hypothetical protein